jgi:hypothetical protein
VRSNAEQAIDRIFGVSNRAEEGAGLHTAQEQSEGGCFWREIFDG